MVEALAALTATTFLLLGSPGPAPLALAATGASYGVRKGVPFLAGILSGLAVAIIGATAGLAAAFANFPNVRSTVQVLGGMYICYVAYKIATGPVLEDDVNSGISAPNFADGFILNLLNPKAYAAFLAIFSQFLLPLSGTLTSFIVTGVVCFLVAVVVDVLWLCFGKLIGPLFKKPKEARMLRITFAALMIVAVIAAFRV